jgi:hypothetical protein
MISQLDPEAAMATPVPPSSFPLDRILQETAARLAEAGSEKLFEIAVKEALPVGEAIFEAGGKHVLSEGMKGTVRQMTGEVLQKGGLLLGENATAIAEASTDLVKGAGESACSEVGKALAKEGGRSIARAAAGTLGRAAGVGALVDAGITACTQAGRLRRGEISTAQYATQVGKAGMAGGVASAAGAGAVVVLVAFTGPVSAPIAVGVAALTCLGTRKVMGQALGC